MGVVDGAGGSMAYPRMALMLKALSVNNERM